MGIDYWRVEAEGIIIEEWSILNVPDWYKRTDVLADSIRYDTTYGSTLFVPMEECEHKWVSAGYQPSRYEMVKEYEKPSDGKPTVDDVLESLGLTSECNWKYGFVRFYYSF
jgi:hypothetical protein